MSFEIPSRANMSYEAPSRANMSFELPPRGSLSNNPSGMNGNNSSLRNDISDIPQRNYVGQVSNNNPLKGNSEYNFKNNLDPSSRKDTFGNVNEKDEGSKK